MGRIEEFKEYLTRNGYASKTVDHYVRAIDKISKEYQKDIYLIGDFKELERIRNDLYVGRVDRYLLRSYQGRVRSAMKKYCEFFNQLSK